ncbi:MAG: non-homologous end-joining DNA ligase [Actinomycetota bacterium]|nr:non-homologous end-joining DNA ligase [Actinomycetota bacterium]
MSPLKVGRRVIDTSNEHKVLFPGNGVTKGDLIAYYDEVASVMVPHLKGRPLTIQRFPDGIEKNGFYQKDASKYLPEWIHTKRLPKDKGTVNHVICDNPATLVYLANQAAITLHTGTSRVDRIEQPDQLIFDLDPPEDAFRSAQEAAELLSELLEEIGLPLFAKTTGGKGLHIVVPLRRGWRYREVRAFAEDTARVVALRSPQRLTTEFRKAKRENRLYLDVARNAYGAHAVAPYSVRPSPEAPVSTPLSSAEIFDRDLRPETLTVKSVPERIGAAGDPWAQIRASAVSLTRAREALDKLLAST